MKELSNLNRHHQDTLNKSSLVDVANALAQRAEIGLGIEQSVIKPLNQNTLYVEAESPFGRENLVDAALSKIPRATESQLGDVVKSAIEKNAIVYEINPSTPIPAEVALSKVGYKAAQKREELIKGETIKLAIENYIPGI